ncbi:hypothetical protein SAY86_012704 [Trapa natans]|uniref:Uncharacterized protein n=1 Tax=Trapa natans TaxID=22666 RepID=A0AAN7MDE3_TRANT|nr:hypothetical protein SAY86_012704 [Trapa natans]
MYGSTTIHKNRRKIKHENSLGVDLAPKFYFFTIKGLGMHAVNNKQITFFHHQITLHTNRWGLPIVLLCKKQAKRTKAQMKLWTVSHIWYCTIRNVLPRRGNVLQAIIKRLIMSTLSYTYMNYLLFKVKSNHKIGCNKCMTP